MLTVGETSVEATKQRYLYLDLVKIAACFMVIVNHSNSSVFLGISPSPTWFVSVAVFFLSKPAVPLFLMASGAVLLGREEHISAALKRAARILAVLYISSAFYFYLTAPLPKLSLVNLKSFLITTLHTPATNALWYLYLYLGLLLMLPLLNRLVKVLTPRDYVYIAVLGIGIRGTVPIVKHYFPNLFLSSYFLTPLFTAYLAFFLCGYWLHKRGTPSGRTTAKTATLCAALVLLCVAATYAECRKVGQEYLFLDNTAYLPIALCAIGFFVIIQYLAPRLRVPDRAARVIAAVGQCTFGIYIMSDYALMHFMPVRVALTSVFHPLVAVFIYQLFVFALGLVFTYLLRLIPFMRKLL